MIRRKCSEKLDESMAENSVRSHYRQFSANELLNRRLLPGNPLRRMEEFIDWACLSGNLSRLIAIFQPMHYANSANPDKNPNYNLRTMEIIGLIDDQLDYAVDLKEKRSIWLIITYEWTEISKRFTWQRIFIGKKEKFAQLEKGLETRTDDESISRNNKDITIPLSAKLTEVIDIQMIKGTTQSSKSGGSSTQTIVNAALTT